ncbi:DUF1178 family protein [Rhodovarius crocodyli]|uniref:DUF1178 family protein n=1 Tax=Rhodovarius crocodyli TaxID=1979269 RepID=A0A437MCJ0_9PROT|nr:DUF1178 family protein [Rhodovarius crocodyli]RVT95335.1 DUF1178 family protein [Rhodovarius crocodyli]
MISFSLRCDSGHQFDSWFRSSDAFESQARAGLVECPHCGSAKVEKALMAPAVARVPGAKGRPDAVPAPAPAEAAPAPTKAVAPKAMPAELVSLLQRMRAEVEKNCDYVGNQFAEEARRIHNGDADERGIYGEATEAEAEALRDEGIEIGNIPWLPRADS